MTSWFREILGYPIAIAIPNFPYNHGIANTSRFEMGPELSRYFFVTVSQDFYMFQGCYSDSLNLLLRPFSIDFVQQSDRTPLHLAAEEGHHDIVSILLDSNAEFNVQDEVS